MMPWDDPDAVDDIMCRWELSRPIFNGEVVKWAEGECTLVTIGQKSDPKHGVVMAFPKGFNPDLDMVRYIWEVE
jgi:hypothetical protein